MLPVEWTARVALERLIISRTGDFHVPYGKLFAKVISSVLASVKVRTGLGSEGFPAWGSQRSGNGQDAAPGLEVVISTVEIVRKRVAFVDFATLPGSSSASPLFYFIFCLFFFCLFFVSRVLGRKLDVASRKLPIISANDAKLAASLEKHISDLDARVRKQLSGCGGR